MSRVITFSRVFPYYHTKKGEQTNFVESILYGLIKNEIDGYHTESLRLSIVDIKKLNPDCIKKHTIRSGNRWKVGDKFSPRVWSGKPYDSKMIIIGPDIEVKKTWKFEVINGCIFIDDQLYAYSSSTELLDKLASNDGLNQIELLDWFKYPKDLRNHQIICWDETVEY